MDELLAYLRTQLEADERVALRSVGSGRPNWTLEPDGDVARIVEGEVTIIGRVDRLDAEHIVLWDPARTLALTAALRRLLDEFSGEASETRALVTLGAALYAGRPGWRDDWL